RLLARRRLVAVQHGGLSGRFLELDVVGGTGGTSKREHEERECPAGPHHLAPASGREDEVEFVGEVGEEAGLVAAPAGGFRFCSISPGSWSSGTSTSSDTPPSEK